MAVKCHCHMVKPEECPVHGIAASNARENDFWERQFCTDTRRIEEYLQSVTPIPDLWKWKLTDDSK